VCWKVAEGSPFFSGLSQSSRTLRVMTIDTLPHPALTAGRRSARATAAGDDPVLWLVRHGESTWNALGLAQGQSDQPRLTRPGTLQAQHVADVLRGLPIGVVFSSDLRRAMATAAPLATALRLDATPTHRLRERSLGVLEGTPRIAVRPTVSGVARCRVIDPDARPPGGESLRDLYWRVAGFADDLLAANQPGQRCDAAVVAHGGTLRVLTAYLRGVPVDRMSWGPIANGTIVRLPLQARQHGC
jgi:2,3-bisphosphoglycerate-dependent phosphoglycerate mutase